jgi:hypothetical protein
VAISAARVTVTTTPTLLTVGRDRDGKPGRSATIYNPGPETVYIGDENVADDTGYALTAGADIAIDLALERDEDESPVYGVVTTTDQECHVLQAGV